jgi:hypothetical protein
MHGICCTYACIYNTYIHIQTRTHASHAHSKKEKLTNFAELLEHSCLPLVLITDFGCGILHFLQVYIRKSLCMENKCLRPVLELLLVGSLSFAACAHVCVCVCVCACVS